ncbi:AAA15 family ATPase/GTPase [Hydrogenispora ethanolica]|jgi:AAA15 family ATPase/GTPase|uniref:AAA15 family ATPase/GTPase n=1 Tax=Hydrogenispora ethanolica TaxID=1082276 RepID=A0A4R1RQN1_HYDET|nr:ATP-binding protein [Hydrogenispora ethanolica]TCL68549.1 AAA15 family ATPase/GTPase [Hydrogenispora ethanolica]
MIYIQDLTIKVFRGINELKLKNLAEINIITGINNSGKTSILEAIRLIENPLDIINAVRISRQRENLFPPLMGRGRLGSFDSFINMFGRDGNINRIVLSGNFNSITFDLKIEGTIEKRLLDIDEFKKNSKNRYGVVDQDIINGEIDCFVGIIGYTKNGKHTEENVLLSRYDKFISNNRNATINIEYLSPIDHIIKNTHINQLIKSGLKSEVIDVLRIFDPQIKGLEMIGEGFNIVPYIDHENLGLMPLSTYGDGLKKVLLLASSIVKAKNGILLIDEIETAIHVSALEEIFKWFVVACQKFQVQVFATTHSLEVIDAILKGVAVSYEKNNINAENDPLRVITLKKQNQKTLARSLPGKEALNSREEFDMELRQ